MTKTAEKKLPKLKPILKKKAAGKKLPKLKPIAKGGPAEGTPKKPRPKAAAPEKAERKAKPPAAGVGRPVSEETVRVSGQVSKSTGKAPVEVTFKSKAEATARRNNLTQNVRNYMLKHGHIPSGKRLSTAQREGSIFLWLSEVVGF